MNIQTFIVLYAISVPVFFVIDMIWLGLVASSFYKNQLGDLMQISWVPAVAFYLVYLIGLIFFVVYPSVGAGSWKMALVYGALFGFFTYATYDMTNLATLKDWPIAVVVVDIAWGTVLGSAVAVATYYLYSLI
jgi:uncharacterized membrane protein